MGAWGFKAYENDGAADWFADMHAVTGVRDHVVATLRQGAQRSGTGAIRGAAHVVEKLGHVYTWPVGRWEDDIRLAIKALGEVRAMEARRLQAPRLSRLPARKGRRRVSKSLAARRKRDGRKMLRAIDKQIARLQKRANAIEERQQQRLAELDDTSDKPAKGKVWRRSIRR
jgi:hypothetical protein